MRRRRCEAAAPRTGAPGPLERGTFAARGGGGGVKAAGHTERGAVGCLPGVRAPLRTDEGRVGERLARMEANIEKRRRGKAR
mgnify:CR=1 FL=1